MYVNKRVLATLLAAALALPSTPTYAGVTTTTKMDNANYPGSEEISDSLTDPWNIKHYGTVHRNAIGDDALGYTPDININDYPAIKGSYYRITQKHVLNANNTKVSNKTLEAELKELNGGVDIQAVDIVSERAASWFPETGNYYAVGGLTSYNPEFGTNKTRSQHNIFAQSNGPSESKYQEVSGTTTNDRNDYQFTRSRYRITVNNKMRGTDHHSDYYVDATSYPGNKANHKNAYTATYKVEENVVPKLRMSTENLPLFYKQYDSWYLNQYKKYDDSVKSRRSQSSSYEQYWRDYEAKHGSQSRWMWASAYDSWGFEDMDYTLENKYVFYDFNPEYVRYSDAYVAVINNDPTVYEYRKKYLDADTKAEEAKNNINSLDRITTNAPSKPKDPTSSDNTNLDKCTEGTNFKNAYNTLNSNYDSIIDAFNTAKLAYNAYVTTVILGSPTAPTIAKVSQTSDSDVKSKYATLSTLTSTLLSKRDTAKQNRDAANLTAYNAYNNASSAKTTAQNKANEQKTIMDNNATAKQRYDWAVAALNRDHTSPLYGRPRNEMIHYTVIYKSAAEAYDAAKSKYDAYMAEVNTQQGIMNANKAGHDAYVTADNEYTTYSTAYDNAKKALDAATPLYNNITGKTSQITTLVSIINKVKSAKENLENAEAERDAAYATYKTRYQQCLDNMKLKKNSKSLHGVGLYENAYQTSPAGILLPPEMGMLEDYNRNVNLYPQVPNPGDYNPFMLYTYFMPETDSDLNAIVETSTSKKDQSKDPGRTNDKNLIYSEVNGTPMYTATWLQRKRASKEAHQKITAVVNTFPDFVVNKAYVQKRINSIWDHRNDSWRVPADDETLSYVYDSTAVAAASSSGKTTCQYFAYDPNFELYQQIDALVRAGTLTSKPTLTALTDDTMAPYLSGSTAFYRKCDDIYQTLLFSNDIRRAGTDILGSQDWLLASAGTYSEQMLYQDYDHRTTTSKVAEQGWFQPAADMSLTPRSHVKRQYFSFEIYLQELQPDGTYRYVDYTPDELRANSVEEGNKKHIIELSDYIFRPVQVYKKLARYMDWNRKNGFYTTSKDINDPDSILEKRYKRDLGSGNSRYLRDDYEYCPYWLGSNVNFMSDTVDDSVPDASGIDYGKSAWVGPAYDIQIDPSKDLYYNSAKGIDYYTERTARLESDAIRAGGTTEQIQQMIQIAQSHGITLDVPEASLLLEGDANHINFRDVTDVYEAPISTSSLGIDTIINSNGLKLYNKDDIIYTTYDGSTYVPANDQTRTLTFKKVTKDWGTGKNETKYAATQETYSIAQPYMTLESGGEVGKVSKTRTLDSQGTAADYLSMYYVQRIEDEKFSGNTCTVSFDPYLNGAYKWPTINRYTGEIRKPEFKAADDEYYSTIHTFVALVKPTGHTITTKNCAVSCSQYFYLRYGTSASGYSFNDEYENAERAGDTKETNYAQFIANVIGTYYDFSTGTPDNLLFSNYGMSVRDLSTSLTPMVNNDGEIDDNRIKVEKNSDGTTKHTEVTKAKYTQVWATHSGLTIPQLWNTQLDETTPVKDYEALAAPDEANFTSRVSRVNGTQLYNTALYLKTHVIIPKVYQGMPVCLKALPEFEQGLHIGKHIDYYVSNPQFKELKDSTSGTGTVPVFADNSNRYATQFTDIITGNFEQSNTNQILFIMPDRDLTIVYDSDLVDYAIHKEASDTQFSSQLFNNVNNVALSAFTTYSKSNKATAAGYYSPTLGIADITDGDDIFAREDYIARYNSSIIKQPQIYYPVHYKRAATATGIVREDYVYGTATDKDYKFKQHTKDHTTAPTTLAGEDKLGILTTWAKFTNKNSIAHYVKGGSSNGEGYIAGVEVTDYPSNSSPNNFTFYDLDTTTQKLPKVGADGLVQNDKYISDTRMFVTHYGINTKIEAQEYIAYRLLGNPVKEYRVPDLWNYSVSATTDTTDTTDTISDVLSNYISIFNDTARDDSAMKADKDSLRHDISIINQLRPGKNLSPDEFNTVNGAIQEANKSIDSLITHASNNINTMISDYNKDKRICNNASLEVKQYYLRYLNGDDGSDDHNFAIVTNSPAYLEYKAAVESINKITSNFTLCYQDTTSYNYVELALKEYKKQFDSIEFAITNPPLGINYYYDKNAKGKMSYTFTLYNNTMGPYGDADASATAGYANAGEWYSAKPAKKIIVDFTNPEKKSAYPEFTTYANQTAYLANSFNQETLPSGVYPLWGDDDSRGGQDVYVSDVKGIAKHSIESSTDVLDMPFLSKIGGANLKIKATEQVVRPKFTKKTQGTWDLKSDGSHASKSWTQKQIYKKIYGVKNIKLTGKKVDFQKLLQNDAYTNVFPMLNNQVLTTDMVNKDSLLYTISQIKKMAKKTSADTKPKNKGQYQMLLQTDDHSLGSDVKPLSAKEGISQDNLNLARFVGLGSYFLVNESTTPVPFGNSLNAKSNYWNNGYIGSINRKYAAMILLTGEDEGKLRTYREDGEPDYTFDRKSDYAYLTGNSHFITLVNSRQLASRFTKFTKDRKDGKSFANILPDDNIEIGSDTDDDTEDEDIDDSEINDDDPPTIGDTKQNSWWNSNIYQVNPYSRTTKAYGRRVFVYNYSGGKNAIFVGLRNGGSTTSGVNDAGLIIKQSATGQTAHVYVTNFMYKQAFAIMLVDDLTLYATASGKNVALKLKSGKSGTKLDEYEKRKYTLKDDSEELTNFFKDTNSCIVQPNCTANIITNNQAQVRAIMPDFMENYDPTIIYFDKETNGWDYGFADTKEERREIRASRLKNTVVSTPVVKDLGKNATQKFNWEKGSAKMGHQMKMYTFQATKSSQANKQPYLNVDDGHYEKLVNTAGIQWFFTGVLSLPYYYNTKPSDMLQCLADSSNVIPYIKMADELDPKTLHKTLVGIYLMYGAPSFSYDTYDSKFHASPLWYTSYPQWKALAEDFGISFYKRYEYQMPVSKSLYLSTLNRLYNNKSGIDTKLSNSGSSNVNYIAINPASSCFKYMTLFKRYVPALDYTYAIANIDYIGGTFWSDKLVYPNDKWHSDHPVTKIDNTNLYKMDVWDITEQRKDANKYSTYVQDSLGLFYSNIVRNAYNNYGGIDGCTHFSIPSAQNWVLINTN